MPEKKTERKMPDTVDEYLKDGCGRCDKWATVDCKIHPWKSLLLELRQMAQDSGLDETIKWGQPCYTHQGKNVLLVMAFKEYCGMSFMRPSLLTDVDHLLEKSGPNAQESGVIRLNSLEDLQAKKPQIAKLIQQAKEKALQKSPQKEKAALVYPDVLSDFLANDQAFKMAFEQLTLGRQRGYCIFFDQPKKEETKLGRIQKMRAKILDGKGLHD